MINIQIEENKGRISVVATGHAEDGGKINPIVCAAHSMLAFTLGECILSLSSEGKTTGAPKVFIDDGTAVIKVKPKPEFYDEVLFCVWFYANGINLLLRKYPQYIKVSTREGDINKTESST